MTASVLERMLNVQVIEVLDWVLCATLCEWFFQGEVREGRVVLFNQLVNIFTLFILHFHH